MRHKAKEIKAHRKTRLVASKLQRPVRLQLARSLGYEGAFLDPQLQLAPMEPRGSSVKLPGTARKALQNKIKDPSLQPKLSSLKDRALIMGTPKP